MSRNSELASLNSLVWTAILAALVAVGAWISLPLGPVPFTLQTMFVILTGLILGPVRGGAALGLYVAAGLLGLPIFSGGKSGLAALLGPTGGFILGFAAQAAISGLASGGRQENFTLLKGVVWGLAGLAALYGLGVAWLKFSLELDWARAYAAGMAIYILPDLVKLALALAVYRFMAARRLLPL